MRRSIKKHFAPGPVLVCAGEGVLCAPPSLVDSDVAVIASQEILDILLCCRFDTWNPPPSFGLKAGVG